MNTKKKKANAWGLGFFCCYAQNEDQNFRAKGNLNTIRARHAEQEQPHHLNSALQQHSARAMNATSCQCSVSTALFHHPDVPLHSDSTGRTRNSFIAIFKGWGNSKDNEHIAGSPEMQVACMGFVVRIPKQWKAATAPPHRWSL